ncbi:MAG: L,D-transpeptidase family protein [Selenomonadaceae bacterium]|nr:L,D-transpeptidase family protein [Selenomonadaceae bacterium]
MLKKIFALILVVSFLLVNKVSAEQSPQWVKNLPAAKTATQLFIVAQVGEKTTAWISMHEKINGDWQQIMTTPGFIGKKGLGKTKEGDAKTPVGIFHFTKAFGIATDPGCRLPYTQVDENIYWSGDSNFHYNEMVNIKDFPALNTADSEHIIDYNPHYIYCLNISYNENGTAGKGSAIFLHCFGDKKPWTGGCVAIPEAKMLFVMQNVKSDCVVVIDSLKNFGGEI